MFFRRASLNATCYQSGDINYRKVSKYGTNDKIVQAELLSYKTQNEEVASLIALAKGRPPAMHLQLELAQFPPRIIWPVLELDLSIKGV